jgi:hypothetical protein
MRAFLILLALAMPACSTINQAKTDFQNFRKTIALNASQPAVYKANTF